MSQQAMSTPLDHGGHGAARPEVGVRPEHLVPERFDLRGVVALEQAVKLAERGGDGPVGDRRRGRW